jgi:hypothetical protein
MDRARCIKRNNKLDFNASYTSITLYYLFNQFFYNLFFQKCYILWPLILSKYVSGSNSLVFYSKALPIKLIICLFVFVFVYFTSYFKNPITDDYDYKMYLICFFLSFLISIIESTMYVSQMAFFASISILFSFLKSLKTIS